MNDFGQNNLFRKIYHLSEKPSNCGPYLTDLPIRQYLQECCTKIFFPLECHKKKGWIANASTIKIFAFFFRNVSISNKSTKIHAVCVFASYIAKY